MKKKKKSLDWNAQADMEELGSFGSDVSKDAEENEDALSYEEMQMLRSSTQKSEGQREALTPYHTSDGAGLVRFAKKNKLLTAAVIVIALALLAAIGLGIFWLISYLNSRPNTSDFTVVLGENDPYIVPYDEAVRENGVLYIDMVKVAEFTDAMIISGTKSNRKFTAFDSTSLRFENGSEIARINGKRVEMWVTPLLGGQKVLAKAEVTEDECWIPYSFLIKVVAEGMRFRVDPETNTITIKHLHYMENGDKENAMPADILFHLGDFKPLPTGSAPAEYKWVYTIDIDPYLNAIASENLLLANKTHPLGKSFKPDVVELTCATASNRTLYLDQDAATALHALMAEMEASGITDVFITSAYRSYDRQYELFFNTYYQDEKNKHPTWTDEQIYAEIATYSAYPGTSEHQTGLCVDFMTSDMIDLDNSFVRSAAFRWLSENAYKFGFILRYPEDKVDVTQYSYESWHYRFVGRDAATEMYLNDLCLEEYLGETPS